MSEGPWPLPEGWRWVRLGDLFELQQGVAMCPKRRAGRSPVPFLRTKNVRWGEVDLTELDEMDFTESEVERLRLRPGDLLVCEGGDVGRTAIWRDDHRVVLFQNHIHRLRRRSESVCPEFYMRWMEAAYRVFRHYQGAESRTAIPNLSARRLAEFTVPLPPLDEQKRIVAHLDAVRERVDELRAAQDRMAETLEMLERSILDRAFRGGV